MSIVNLFEGEDFSAEFKDKVVALFNTTLNESVATKEQELVQKHNEEIIQLKECHIQEIITLKEDNTAKVAELTDTIKTIKEEHETTLVEKDKEYKAYVETYISETVAPKINNFLDYVVEEWVKENKVAIESSIRTEMAESFLDGLQVLFSEHYISVPEAKQDLVDTLSKQVTDIELQASTVVNENIELKNIVKEYKKAAIVSEVTKDLADTQKEKFILVSESVGYENDEQYKGRLESIKKTLIGEGVKPSKPNQTSVAPTITESVSQNQSILDLAQEIGKLNKKSY